MADGLKITLSKIGGGLTVNKQGRPLLTKPFVFQCPPLEEFQIAHSQNFGTYDTIDDDQFIRRGSRQLDTWQYDTLMMYLGANAQGHYGPSWVPYPTKEPGGTQYYSPEWYRGQLWDLHDAGAPFRFVAAFHQSTTIRRAYAVLTGFSEVYKHGEGDAIYLAGVTFSEWRDPGDATAPKKRGSTKLPAHVKFQITGAVYLAYDANTGLLIAPPHAKPSPTTQYRDTRLSDLAQAGTTVTAPSGG